MSHEADMKGILQHTHGWPLGLYKLGGGKQANRYALFNVDILNCLKK